MNDFLPQMLGEDIAAAIAKAAGSDAELAKSLGDGDVEATVFALWAERIIEKKHGRQIQIKLPVVGQSLYKNKAIEVNGNQYNNDLQSYVKLWNDTGHQGSLLPKSQQESLKKAIALVEKRIEKASLSGQAKDGLFTAKKDGKVVAKIAYEIQGDQVLKKNVDVKDLSMIDDVLEVFRKTVSPRNKYSIITPNNTALGAVLYGIKDASPLIKAEIEQNIVVFDSVDMRKSVCSSCGDKPFHNGELVGCRCHSSLKKSAKMLQLPNGKRKIIFQPQWANTLQKSLQDWGFTCKSNTSA